MTAAPPTMIERPLAHSDRAPTRHALPVLSPAHAAPRPAGLDRHGRTVRYLRLSLTRACSMRCTYCRPDFDRGGDAASMDADDLAFLVAHLHQRFDLRKVRLTGGEPTTRHDLSQIVERLAGMGIPELVMTTNALTLARDANRLRDAGLSRVNISLDTLDPRKFEQLTGVDGLQRVLAGIDAALDAGLTPVKLNTVVVAGQNEADLGDLVRFAGEHDISLRLIELMPMGPLASDWERRYVPEARMREALADTVERFVPVPDAPSGGGSDAARLYRAELRGRGGGSTTVGFITPMSCNFCATCDRLRLTADGGVYPCLMDEPRGNLRDAVRERDGDTIDAVIDRAYDDKAAEHPPAGPAIMTHLGG